MFELRIKPSESQRRNKCLGAAPRLNGGRRNEGGSKDFISIAFENANGFIVAPLSYDGVAKDLSAPWRIRASVRTSINRRSLFDRKNAVRTFRGQQRITTGNTAKDSGWVMDSRYWTSPNIWLASITRPIVEMGADIIKVELAPMGDPSQLLSTVKNGRSGYFVQQNRGKKSLCLDFSKPASLEIIRELVRKVDIVVKILGLA